MKKARVEINEPIAGLILQLKTATRFNKKVAEKLENRFDMQDWQVQIEILNAFLDCDAKTARRWLYGKMLASYQDSLNSIIRIHKDARAKMLKSRIMDDCRNHLDEFQPAYFAVCHAPLKFVRDNEKRLARTLDCEYHKLAMRLAADRNWIPDKDRCIGLTYYDVMAQHNRKVPFADAREDFLKYFVWNARYFRLDAKPHSLNTKFSISLLYSAEILNFINSMEKMGYANFADGIRQWDLSLQNRLMPLYQADTIMHPYPVWIQNDYFIRIFYSMAANDIKTSLYAGHALERFIADNRHLMKIIHDLDLEIVDTIPF